MIVTTVFSKQERAYTGVELRPHFLLTELGLKGSGVAAFIGSCRVETEHLVDWEDRLASDRIEARSMVHFIGEFFGLGAQGLREGVLLQRHFMAMAGEVLNEKLSAAGSPDRITRSGDDLFCRGRKLSVSIVTASPVSLLLHCGINIDPEGAPVPAVGVRELGVMPADWVGELLDRFARELNDVEWAISKVRPV